MFLKAILSFFFVSVVVEKKEYGRFLLLFLFLGRQYENRTWVRIGICAFVFCFLEVDCCAQRRAYV
jgi:hypothetical protein